MDDPAKGAPPPALIEAQGLSKHYGSFAAIRDVTFSVPRGQVAAFLGPNGAGKSTTMKILTGYLAPTSGTSRIAGFDIATDRVEAAKRLGYLPENGPLYQDMTPLGLLTFFGRVRGLDRDVLSRRIGEVTARCGIGPVLQKPIQKLSKGYRQRVGMAHVLLHDPDVLIMDEPTSGLDPNQIVDVRAAIRELGKTKAILLSTHILQEVQAVADRVIFIHDGRIVFDGTPAQMTADGGTMDEFFHKKTRPVAEPEQAGEKGPVTVA
ncbi:MAG: ATP-binding cassette domain-containing protein [Planctomycetes bacterium]|nr:ATP-binding cassette domain-containing protein [Planctomycetota bacterium]